MTITTHLNPPERSGKPRQKGLTVLLDRGLSTNYFCDVIESHERLIDWIKFGWGTPLVTTHFEKKIQIARESGIRVFIGGTLFEKFQMQDKLEDFISLCRCYGLDTVEVANGSGILSQCDKVRYVAELARDFTVISEVGYKDRRQSLQMSPDCWIRCIHEDLNAGAAFVLAEARESGSSGICDGDGELRADVLHRLVASDLPVEQIVFEAPTKMMQVELIRQLGPEVNLANIGFDDVVALETLRLGLRSDTLNLFGNETDAQRG